MPIQQRFQKAKAGPSAVTPINSPRLLSPKAAAVYLSMSVDVVRKLMKNGTIRHVRNGRRYLIDRVDLDRHIEKVKLGVVAYG
jgi:excisionase family DNA binding protein